MIPHRNEFFLCYSSKEASICKRSHDDNGQLHIVKRFFKVSAIKSILSNLIIQKIVIRPQSSTKTTDPIKFTLVVLVNDDSLYIYENVRLENPRTNNGNDNDDVSSGVSIQLTKHIHPIEQRDLHGRHLKNHRTNHTNNSE